jgi:hypothetical protein
MKYNKQDIIQLIEDRILSEYKKHSTSLPDEWAKIAAYKIYKSISDKIEEPKKEILEEAAENHINKFYTTYAFKKVLESLFIDGAKWQAERMYSESDKIMKFLNTEKELKLSDAKTIERIKWYFETYFEQFKKK